MHTWIDRHPLVVGFSLATIAALVITALWLFGGHMEDGWQQLPAAEFAVAPIAVLAAGAGFARLRLELDSSGRIIGGSLATMIGAIALVWIIPITIIVIGHIANKAGAG
jgi:uncharacterized membrane protein